MRGPAGHGGGGGAGRPGHRSRGVRRGLLSAGQGDGERGSGLLSTTLGVLFFLGFLLLAVQVVVHLYATSVVTTAALDAARIASGAQFDERTGPPVAEEQFRAILGRYQERVSDVDVVYDDPPGTVAVSVAVESPSIIPSLTRRGRSFDEIRRTVTVRREALR